MLFEAAEEKEEEEEEDKEEEEDTCIWQCHVRYVTFIGVGKDAHTFALITDMGQQRFQCTVFWCEPDAGIVSEAVQAACMVNAKTLMEASAGFQEKLLLTPSPDLSFRLSYTFVLIFLVSRPEARWAGDK